MMRSLKPAIIDSLLIIGVYVAIGAGFTLLSLVTSSHSVQIGTLRPVASIPPHEVFLAGAALLICLFASVAYRRFDFSFLFLPLVFIILLDFDHLPSALGLAQPIRPAHSVLFLLALVLLLRYALKRPAFIELLAVSSFMGHIAVDTGVFPLLSPVSFQYYDLASVRGYLLVASFVVAFIAGYTKRKSLLVQLGPLRASTNTERKPVSSGLQLWNISSKVTKIASTNIRQADIGGFEGDHE